MNTAEALLARLDAIACSLEASGHAEALIGLGSVGLELDRLDEYSDLDFFAIVNPALAALAFLEQHFPVNQALAACIRELAGPEISRTRKRLSSLPKHVILF